MEKEKNFKVRGVGDKIEFDNGITLTRKDKKIQLFVDEKEIDIETMLPPIFLALQLNGAKGGSFNIAEFRFDFDFSVVAEEE